MPKQLSAKAISRFAAVHGFDLAQTIALVKAMSPEQRRNIASIYATTELLDEDERILADSMRIRMKLADMEMRSRSSRDLDWEPDWTRCPYETGSREAADWAAEEFNRLPDHARRSHFND